MGPELRYWQQFPQLQFRQSKSALCSGFYPLERKDYRQVPRGLYQKKMRTQFMEIPTHPQLKPERRIKSTINHQLISIFWLFHPPSHVDLHSNGTTEILFTSFDKRVFDHLHSNNKLRIISNTKVLLMEYHYECSQNCDFN